MDSKNGKDERTPPTRQAPQPVEAWPPAGAEFSEMVLKDRYLIKKKLSQGGMGIIYFALDTRVHMTPVVIKVLSDGPNQTDWLKKKFRQESEALARVRHPGVVKVLDTGDTPDEQPYIVMEFIEGATLRSVMGHDGMEFGRTAHIMREVGKALHFAHERGVYHRDLKPENIMLLELGDSEDHVKLIDFGIAKVKNSLAGSSTRDPVLAGTLPYMPPEQLQGSPQPLHELLTAADTYALGVIAYEMLTGRRPFVPDASNQLQAMQQLIELQKAGVRVPPMALRFSLPETAQDVILRALSYDPGERQRSARDFTEELAWALTNGAGCPDEAAGKPPDSPPHTPAEPAVPSTLVDESPAETEQGPALLMAHVLFMDIVGYSRLSMGKQTRCLVRLNEIVRGTNEFRRAQSRGQLMCLPTGDGMALVFFADPLAAVQCAIEIDRECRQQQEFKLRMGVHSGPVYQVPDINFNKNVSGGGINLAQRVMDCGDAGHILLSRSVADILSQLSDWEEQLHDLGEVRVKHNVVVHLFNLYSDEIGNPAPPKYVSDDATVTGEFKPPPPPATWQADEMGILLQTLGVSFNQESNERAGLWYRPAPLYEGAKEHVFVPVRLAVLQQQLVAARSRVEDLTRRALVRQKRNGCGIEESAAALASSILPAAGFAGMLGAGIHPQLDIIQGAASEIPWEVLEEGCFTCPRCGHNAPAPNRRTASQPFCMECGTRMTCAGGKLALSYHLSHLVRGTGHPGGEGRQFLFVEDPTGALCDPSNDPDGVCARHLTELHELLARLDFRILRLQNAHATVGNFLKAISDPDVAGVYFFGHGFFPTGGDEGCLMLADGQVFAGEVLRAGPAARLVFLNTCEGSVHGRVWDFDRSSSSVAHAFARGGRGKVAIAPLWPAVNVQAAETALEFFRVAAKSSPLGAALRAARLNSFQRYETGEPHMSWMAYRFFGDPNRMLPVPRGAAAHGGRAAEPFRASRIFDANGQLNTEMFSFDLSTVLLRAAKRRNVQERARVSVADFIGGMVRKGDLTRFVIRRLGAAPDEIYKKIEALVEPQNDGTAAAALKAAPVPFATAAPRPERDEQEAPEDDPDKVAEEKFREIIAKWIVRDIAEFDESLVAILERAERLAAAPAERKLNELDVLHSLFQDETWWQLSATGLPAVAGFKEVLRQRALSGEVDENGVLSLAALDADARKVVEAAHTLSQQRGVSPIPNRMFLAAFLNEEKSHAARALQDAGHDPQLVFDVLIATTTKDDDTPPTPISFGLSQEACERIVLPSIEHARAKKRGSGLVTEEELFTAFCEMADPYLKAALRQEPLSLSLDDFTPDGAQFKGLDTAARRVLEDAEATARARGVPVMNRLVLVAFIATPERFASRLLVRGGLNVEWFRQQLIASTHVGPRFASTPDQAAWERVVSPIVVRARELVGGAGVVTEELLFKAFCEVCAPEFKLVLKAPPVNLDLDALGAEIKGSSEVPPAGNERSGAAGAQTNPAHGATNTGSRAEASPGQQTLFTRESYEEGAWRVLEEAERLAREQGWEEMKSPHLFAAMLGSPNGPATVSLAQEKMNPEWVRAAILSLVPPRPVSPGRAQSVSLSENTRQILLRAGQLAARANRTRVSEDDLFEAFFADSRGGIVGDALSKLGSDLISRAHALHGTPPGGMSVESPGRSILTALGVDLTEKARRGELPEVVGRDDEIVAVMQTLQLTENANPLLVGAAGVGKTAIVEGVALRIAAGRCPTRLQGVRVVELSAGRLLADTRLRGEFEQRIQRVLAEARENTILFIDEIHTIVGTGSLASGLDAGNMLKAALARGEVRLIGATTQPEYKRTIARDKALVRRFQLHLVKPPSREATLQVLSARQAALERHHGVRIADETKTAAVDLSGRFISDEQWPAKARDVLEKACVVAREESPRPEQEVVEVVPRHVAAVIAGLTGLPVEHISHGELSSLAGLEERVNRRVIGQQAAASAVAEVLRRGRRGLSNGDRPWGTFLFVGPSGVGKTEMAKVLAEEVFTGSESLIRYDMGDFTEPHSVSKLTGAPPGYVGYSEGSPLAERLRAQPYSLLLFDEIEHAHEQVLPHLLRLFSEGVLIDSEGDVADARNAIVVMTSNLIGAEHGARRPGFSLDTPGTAAPPSPSTQSDLRSLLDRKLPAKLLNRVDVVVRFNALTQGDLETIARMRVEEIIAHVSALGGMAVEVRPEVFAWLAQSVAHDRARARALQRAVDKYVAVPLGDLLSGSPQGADAASVLIDVVGGEVRVEPAGGV